jgi:hypothetical protein
MFEIPPLEFAPRDNPLTDLKTMRYLGADIVRVNVVWADVAPTSAATASNPTAYSWGWVDNIIKAAHSLGISVDLMLAGPAPTWASAPGAPASAASQCVNKGTTTCWEPSAAAYGQFVKLAGAHFRSVHFWEVWNEPNWGPELSPQYLNSSVPVSAKYYRGLLDAGWHSLSSTGHGHDTISIGNLSQDPGGTPEFGTTAPLTLLKTVYCLSNSYKPLKGSAARQAGCSGSKSAFKSANPGLFSATGVGIHPYPYGNPPTKTLFPNPNGAEFAEIPQFLKGLDKLQKAYGSHKHMVIYNTEFGYRTRPNDQASYFADPTTAAALMNQSEYMSWKNPRVTTYAQYELVDNGWFPTGLFFAPNTVACPGQFYCPKPSFYAYRLPVWVPVTRTKRGHALEVWGGVRAARYARMDTGKKQKVQIQFAPKGSTSFRTVKTVTIGNAYGYFDTRVTFPGSGSVRLTWTYPADSRLSDPLPGLNFSLPASATSPQIFSRTTSITLH